MFSLIITIISIALVAAIAVATLYYGGSQFSQGSAKAQADQLISAAQQIAGANTLYANNNGGSYDSVSVTDLKTNGYLNAVPSVASTVSSSSFDLAGGTTANTVTLPVLGTATAVCAAVEKSNGLLTASVSTPNASLSSTVQYDCYGNTSGYTFQFKG